MTECYHRDCGKEKCPSPATRSCPQDEKGNSQLLLYNFSLFGSMRQNYDLFEQYKNLVLRSVKHHSAIRGHQTTGSCGSQHGLSCSFVVPLYLEQFSVCLG